MFFSRERLAIVCAAIGTMLYLPSTAQENFKPGYIIQISGDTLRGSIDQRNWARSPQKIQFRSSSGRAEEFAPLNIKGFAVNDVSYESAIVETETLVPDNDMFAKVRFQKIIDTVFVEALISGPKSLYEFRINGTSKFYFIKKDGVYELLSYRRYQKPDREKLMHIVEVKLFQGQLSSYLSECPAIGKNLNSMKYDRQSLVKIFVRYYKCTDAPLKFKKKIEPVKFQVGVLAGAATTTLRLGSAMPNAQAGTRFSTSVAPTFGISLDILAPGAQKKWSLYNDIAYSSFSSHGSYVRVINPNVSDSNVLTYGDKYLKLNNILRYRIKINSSLIVFIGAGMENRLSLGPAPNRNVDYSTTYASHNVTQGDFIFVTRKFSTGVVADVGIQAGKFSFEFRYDRGSSILGQPQGQLDSFTHTLFFNLGFRFN